MLEGTLTASTRGFAYLSRGVAHCFTNTGDVTAKTLVLATPAGLENFFAEAFDPAANRTGPPRRLGVQIAPGARTLLLLLSFSFMRRLRFQLRPIFCGQLRTIEEGLEGRSGSYATQEKHLVFWSNWFGTSRILYHLSWIKIPGPSMR